MPVIPGMVDLIAPGGEHLERFGAVAGGAYGEPARFEHARDGLSGRLVVVHHENRLRRVVVCCVGHRCSRMKSLDVQW
jgi:hypothetical protein